MVGIVNADDLFGLCRHLFVFSVDRGTNEISQLATV